MLFGKPTNSQVLGQYPMTDSEKEHYQYYTDRIQNVAQLCAGQRQHVDYWPTEPIDGGKQIAVEAAPWYKLGPTYGEPEGTRINDHHTRLAEKQAARIGIQSGGSR